MPWQEHGGSPPVNAGQGIMAEQKMGKGAGVNGIGLKGFLSSDI
jgi:hypothetical protein